jgi:hypothetical protein
MKVFYIIMLFGCLLNRMTAQLSYSYSPTTTITAVAPLNESTPFKITITNTSNSKLVLNWVKVSNTLPALWQYTTCDNVSCYGYVPNGLKTMDTIAIGGTSFLDLTVEPLNELGSGQVKLYVYQDNFQNSGDTLVWNITSQAVSVEELSVNHNVSVYPNPANNYVNINLLDFENQKNTNIYFVDELGKKSHFSKIETQNNFIDVSALKNGFYNLIMETKGEFISKRIIISK